VKYLKGNDFLLLAPKPMDSWFWKSILQSHDILKLGARRWARPGAVIDLWNDPWIPSLASFRPRPRDSASASVVWSELFSASGGWNSFLIRQLFDEDSTRAILKVPLTTNFRNDKVWFWALSASGDFTVKSLYQAIHTKSPLPE
ncbi:hypothetical protein PanWU01x14_274680, partial [Parasponia andersonii]